MKRFFGSTAWDLIRLALILTALAVIAVTAVSVIRNFVFAEDAEEADDMETGTECWVICTEDSFVNLRMKPKKSALDFGGATCGTRMLTDGRVQNNYLYVYGLAAEETKGWVHTGFVVYDEPKPMNQRAVVVSNGRLAVRYSIGGKLKRWLKPMTEVTILCWSREWCLTNCGYVMTEFLDFTEGTWEGEYDD